MKKTLKYIAGSLAAVMLAGCNDLNTLPMGEYYTDDQRKDAIEENPDAIEGVMAAVYANFYAFEKNIDDFLADFGYPATMLSLDNRSQDMSMMMNYGWFETSELYTDNTPTNQELTCTWGTLYRVVYSSNDLLKTIPGDTENETLLCYKAQALAARGWAYHMLAQLFATPYTVNPQAPGVPVVTELNADEAAANG
ncbi:MAG: RagB/SusD family nutrient uptake outer membrane protein, partial [Muribaculum intestinale]|nr:RagB/SusD family nutrient uptake outer membrane protein [Muribaculum intestinale]